MVASSPTRSSSLFSLLSLGVCLGKNSSSRGGSRSGETSPDLARSSKISLDLISPFLATAPPSPPTKENPTNPTVTDRPTPITDPPDPTSLMDGQRVLSLQTRLSRLG
uniref:Uncharacterized protein n=1 Tax=Fagus sylvatica TaxID=28930 RepID=A0A2N9IEI7_FAGSY